MFVKKLGICLLLVLMSCAENPAFEIDIIIAANQTTNPIVDIASDFEAGQSRGVYFLLDPLNANPAGINDTTGSTVAVPSLDGLGENPEQGSFDIDPSLLSQGVLYRLRMVAFNTGGTQTHIGTSDCPIFNGLTTQAVKICFGTSGGGNPVCGGLTSFSCCEGVTNLTCNE